MPFYQTPGSNFHDLNLDWILTQVKNAVEEWTATKAEWDTTKEAWSETQEAWAELQEYVQNYFANLDVSQEISDKIDAMAADGSLLAVIRSVVTTSTIAATEGWLADHITQETGYVLDDTLSVVGAAADAFAAGNALERATLNVPIIEQETLTKNIIADAASSPSTGIIQPTGDYHQGGKFSLRKIDVSQRIGQYIWIDTYFIERTTDSIMAWAFYSTEYANISSSTVVSDNLVEGGNIIAPSESGQFTFMVKVPTGAKTLIYGRTRDSFIPEGVTPSIAAYQMVTMNLGSRVDTLTNIVAGYVAGLNSNVSLFHSIAVCGSSRDAGYYKLEDPDNPGHIKAVTRNHRSWIACLARMMGCNDYGVYAHDGMSTRNFLTSQYGISAIEDASEPAMELYVCTLGGIEITNTSDYDENYLGSISDIETGSWEDYPDTYYGNYGKIIERILAKAPNCRIVMILRCPDAAGSNTRRRQYFDAMVEIAQHYGLCYMNWADDMWYQTVLEDSMYPPEDADHPPISMYPGISMAFNRLFGAAVTDENFVDYFAAWIPDTSH